MENGVYIAQHRLLESKRRLCVFNGSVKVFTLNGVFLFVLPEKDAEIHFGKQQNWQKVEKKNMLYNIVWMIHGEMKEEIALNASYAVAKWKIGQMKASNYKEGLLIPVPSNLS